MSLTLTFLLLIGTGSAFGVMSNDCKAVYPRDRTDCGYPRIDKVTCKKRGCCFDSTDYGYPTNYCFYPKGHKCHGTDPKKRLECGYLGINRGECEVARGCCYDDNVPDVPYCFRGKDMQADRCKGVDPHKRTDCGYLGIDKQTCESKKCCFDSLNYGFNSKHCFYGTDHKCYGILPKERVDCGFPGITRLHCEIQNGCCYDDSVAKVPYCFKGKDKL